MGVFVIGHPGSTAYASADPERWRPELEISKRFLVPRHQNHVGSIRPHTNEAKDAVRIELSE
jgi:hypothetical protein